VVPESTAERPLAAYARTIAEADLHSHRGRVTNLIGLVIEATGLRAEVGELVTIAGGRNRAAVPAEVVGFRNGRALLMPLGDMRGIAPGTVVAPTGGPFRVAVGDALLGRVLDGLGRPIDGGPQIAGCRPRVVAGSPPSPMDRPRITERLELGVRALDALVPCGRGQRLGIFAGSGVGKSTLLGSIARATTASVNVICLVGERGRELLEFIERDLGDALSRSVVVVATSDQPALVRIKAALVATTIAEHFRDTGADVLLMMDSVTRLAIAQREVGLAIGEPPATRGYTPSVFAMLPQLLERAGTSGRGSITGLYTVLVEGDDMNEPIADAVRSILDGHCVLTRSLAHKSHYPAIDILQSVSRLATEITSPAVRSAAAALRETLAAYKAKEDLITIGAYSPGADAKVDYAIAKVPEIDAFLRQPADEAADATETDLRLMELMADRDGAEQIVESANTDTSIATNGADYVSANRLLEA
jgi:flagellum-specific ATP synthase